MSDPVPILARTPGEVVAELDRMGEPAYRARQLLRWLYERGADEFAAMTNLPRGLRERLASRFFITTLKAETLISSDGARKLRFSLSDGKIIESVWIPEGRRRTLCVSSQAGCALNCAFCVTGAVGFERDLTADEIVAQVRYVRFREALPVTNLVFMGMGEPLLNDDNVARAIEVLSADGGMAIGRRKITVSTAGITPKIKPFLERTGVKLAVSLTGLTDAARNRWMPLNRKFPLDELLRALKGLGFKKGRKMSFEVVLIEGVNDSVKEAELLAELIRGIPASVNVIPYNENPFFPDLKRPSPGRVEKFRDALLKQHVPVIVRRSRGQDIMAACGQLRGAD